MADTIYFAGALDADIDTDYRLEGDQATAGTFATVSTQNATAPYIPVEGELAVALAPATTTLVMVSGASFVEGDHVLVGGEMIVLGVKSTHTFTGSTRGFGGTVRVAHAAGAAIYKAHESFSVTPTWNAGRYVIRYRIVRVQGVDESIGSEVTLYNPPDPPDADHITLYGALENELGEPMPGVDIEFDLSVDTAWGQKTGELLFYTLQTATTGVDGFFSFTARRDVVRQDGGEYVMTIDPLGKNQGITIASLPDQDKVNVLTAAA